MLELHKWYMQEERLKRAFTQPKKLTVHKRQDYNIPKIPYFHMSFKLEIFAGHRWM